MLIRAVALVALAGISIAACGTADVESVDDPGSQSESGSSDSSTSDTGSGSGSESSSSPVTYGTPAGVVGPSSENGDHWHAAYGVNLCGVWQPLAPASESTVGLHSHGDGLLHIHPFSEAGSFENATVEHFFDPPLAERPIGVSDEATLRYQLDPDRITASGTGLVLVSTEAGETATVDTVTFVDGHACPVLGGRKGTLRWAVARYDPALGDYTQGPLEQEGDLATYVPQDNDVITIAFLPADIALDVPPDAAATLQGNFVSPTDGGPPGTDPIVVPTIPTSPGSTIAATSGPGLELRPVVEELDDGENATPEQFPGSLLLPAPGGDSQLILDASILDSPGRVSAEAREIGTGWEILIEMNDADAAVFATYTTEHVGQRLAVVVDGTVLTAPLINTPILDGQISIRGNFTESEAKNIAALLAGG